MLDSNKKSIFWIFVIVLIFTTVLIIPEAVATIEIQGVYGMESSGDEAWLSVKIEVPENQALSRIIWYNNDENTVFPTIRVGTGFEDSPGLIEDFMVVAENVCGVSSGWSEIVFSEPIAASFGSLFLAFEFPSEEIIVSIGLNGGPGFGYLNTSDGCTGWLSGEGEVWARLNQDYSFAVQPIFVPYEEGMAVKSIGGELEEIPEPVTENFLGASPNPFNPKTQFSFGLVESGQVRINIYDLQGRHVVQVQNGYLSAGRHNVQWLGRDSAGRGVSSGVYFVRLVGEGFEFKQKILLVR